MRFGSVLSDDDIAILSSVGRNSSGIQKLINALSPDDAIAMEYLGPITSSAPFDPRLCGHTLAGTGMDVFVITDAYGVPAGIIPLEEHTDRFSAFISLKNTGYTIVTDAVPCTDEIIRALDRSGCDFILRQTQFPPSYGPNSHQKMLSLKYDGKEYSACKCRYEKRWLFMFLCDKNIGSVRDAIGSMDLRGQDSDYLIKSAGYENAISETGHDIREVRKLIDTRIRTDRMMSVCRTIISSDERLLRDRDATIGFILAFVLCHRRESD